MSRRTLILIGVAVFLATAVVRAPLASVYAWMAPRLAGSPVQFLGLSGSLSEGRVAQLGYLGRPLVRDLGWQFRPLWLLLGQAAFQIDGGTEGLIIQGRANFAPTGSISLGNFRIAGPVTPILAAIGQPAPVSGPIRLEMKSLELTRSWPVHADGTITTQGLALVLGRNTSPLGDYEAKLEDEPGGVKATIRTLGGALEVAGDAHFAADRTYEINLQMRTKPDAAPMVVNLVHNSVDDKPPDPQGWYHLQRKGAMGAGAPPSAPLAARVRGRTGDDDSGNAGNDPGQ